MEIMGDNSIKDTVHYYETGDNYLGNESKEISHKFKAVFSNKKEYLNNISNINKPTTQSLSKFIFFC